MAKTTDTRTKERIKANGEVFTPPELVNEIIECIADVDVSLFTDVNKTFLDPAAGEGAFLIGVLETKLFLSMNMEFGARKTAEATKALKSIHGVELEQENVDECKRLMTEVVLNHTGRKKLTATQQQALDDNIICSDAFDWDFENWCKKTSTET
jgi:hypothetical protein